MLSEFDKLVKQRSELKDWWKLGETVCGWGGGHHALRVDVPAPTLVTFCGQAYSGGKTYHDSPKGFTEAVRREMNRHAKAIVQAAYEKEIARLDGLIEKHREGVLRELAKGAT